ncbi:ATP-binding protein [Flavivirga amylovorans]|uniref:histidine kinase n=1 Tax=Flavivirga amylovorans TaxID=870486 RepID=A0ABT8WWU1_9FLAO|nr:hybrid sensor histidine kinase/response regulator transcription factor [Flavivirga amylovorans]MDO5986159.1 ATP-binding protein [Flavivirga amylovorans]
MKVKILSIILAILSVCSSISQNRKLEYIQKYTISEGLAHNGVTSILEDSRGFLWFGTFDGVNRFDGYKFTIFKNTVDKDILTSNRVRSLAEDGNHTIWIGTEKGITLYDQTEAEFKKINTTKSNENIINNAIIKQILIVKEEKVVLVITENSSLLIFDFDYNFLGEYFPGNLSNKKNLELFNCIKLDEQDYLLSSSEGLYLFKLKDRVFKPLLQNEIDYTAYVEHLDDDHFVVAQNDESIVLNYQKDGRGEYFFDVKRKFLKGYRTKTFMVDSTNHLWVGTTRRGLLKMKVSSLLSNEQDIKPYYFDDDLNLLRTSKIISTSKNLCWLSTYNQGVYQFDLFQSPFKSYNSKMNYDYGLKSDNVRHITKIDKDRVYLLSPDADLAIFNTKSHQFEPIRPALLKKISSELTGLYVDCRENLWLRLRGKANLFRLKKGESNLELVELQGEYSPDVVGTGLRYFTEDNYGNIWVGTNRDVYRIVVNKTNEVVEVEALNDNPYFSVDKLSLARFVYADPIHDFIWIGASSDGLFRIENKRGVSVKELSVKQFKKDINVPFSISSDFVSAIVRLPNEEFWIGTEGGGVCKVIDSDTSPKFIPYSEKNGLSNNAVKNVLFDDEYNLWITTNVGLNKLNTKDLSIKKFRESDGLPFEDFFFVATHLENGVIISSGIDGFCYFNPNDIVKTKKLPKIYFENLKIFNEDISPNDTINGRVVLEKSLNQLDEIVLKHNENNFSLDLISLHFLNPKNHNLKYKLLPINDEWQEVPSGQNTIQYNELPHGEYELSVMASNVLNQWSEPKRLKIVIEPSIWNTTFAYILYAILFFLLVYVVVRVILKIQRLSHDVEIEQLTINNVKEVNEAKLRFFSNISHEIKTPITLLSGPIETLLQNYKGNASAKDRLNLMKRQVRKIEHLIDQVHDFRKADANVLKMNYSRFRFDLFIQELITDFKFLAQKDQKELNVESENSKVIVAADRDKLEKIFNNIINNAFKYTKVEDSITIKYFAEDKDLVVVIEDTGQGIDNVDLPHVFERFYQSHNNKNVHASGSGIGLAFSKRLIEMHYGFVDVDSIFGKGTKFTIRLPIVKSHSESEEVVEDILLPEEEEVIFDTKLVQKFVPSQIETSGEFTESLVFYAEDNSEMKHYVSEVLSRYFKVRTFSNGQECLDAMEDRWPDIVISDVQMPEMNGLDLCIRIKSDLKTSHIPVILLTALTNIQDQVQGIRDGADAYIKKPFNVQRLVTNTEALLSGRKKLSERYQVGIPLTRDNNINDRNDNAFLDKLYSLVEENLGNQDFNLNDLAKEMYLNRTHFYQKVKALTNQTPFEFLKMYRLKRAADFLLQKNMSVKEVSIVSGFKSRTHFAKIFKERYKVSPGTYAEEVETRKEADKPPTP